MIGLIIGVLVGAGSHPADEIIRLQREWKACLTTQVVALGGGNREPADTLIRAAHSRCLPVETELRARYAESPLGRAHVEGLMERDRKIGENDGVARLLEARAGQ